MISVKGKRILSVLCEWVCVCVCGIQCIQSNFACTFHFPGERQHLRRKESQLFNIQSILYIHMENVNCILFSNTHTHTHNVSLSLLSANTQSAERIFRHTEKWFKIRE